MDSIREIILSYGWLGALTHSNNWLLENSLIFIKSAMIQHNITTLRMCNVQSPLFHSLSPRLNEKSVLRLCGLKTMLHPKPLFG